MPDRHRGHSREFDRNRGRGPEGPPGARDRDRGAPPPFRSRPPQGDRPFGGPRDDRPFGGSRDERPFGGPPPAPAPYRDRRPPQPPEEAEDFEDVDAGLAVAMLDTAAKLTEIVGTSGLPEEYAARRAAVMETFQAIYFSVMETVLGDEEDEEVEEEE